MCTSIIYWSACATAYGVLTGFLCHPLVHQDEDDSEQYPCPVSYALLQCGHLYGKKQKTFSEWNSDILLSKPHSLFGFQCYSMIRLLSKDCCAVHLLSLEDCQGSCRCCQRIALLSTALWQSPEKCQHLHIKNGEWIPNTFIINKVFPWVYVWY